MTVLALDSQFPFGSVQGLLSWSLTHATEHQAYVDKAVAAGYSLPSSSLDNEAAMWEWAGMMREGYEGGPTQALLDWLLEHSDLHQSELSAAGVSDTINLSTVDFSKMSEFYDWMDRHQQLHDFESGYL